MVTAMDGRPTRVIKNPFSAPPRTPMARHTAIAAHTDHPCIEREPSTLAESPSIEATERSISPVMTIRVIGRAMIAISPKLRPAKKKVCRFKK